MRKSAMAPESNTVSGSKRIKVTAARNAIGSNSQLERRARRSPSAFSRKMPVARQRVRKRAKFRPAGFSQKRKSAAQPSRIRMAQKRVGLVFIDSPGGGKIFCPAYSSGSVRDSQKVSENHELGRSGPIWEQDYKSIRIHFGLLTFKLKCAILPLLFRGANS